MSYKVLARKWRPKTFAEVVGQHHVTRALINSLQQNHLHHSYLLTGTRGVGKTTIARIFAKALSCTQGITATPCNNCPHCLDIDLGRFEDVMEVDAASRTKVEDTKMLLDNVQYAPVRGKYKIYIIDEVHMLSEHSCNALLKTLEESPPHVKFILATTDPQKLPITILSRCLQFNLKKIAPTLIVQHLCDILTREQITFDEPALSIIAQAANGSVRDALSLLDQAIAYSNKNITVASLQEMLNLTNHEQLFALLHALHARDIRAVLNCVNALAEDAVDFANVLDELIQMLHNIAILQINTEDRSSWTNMQISDDHKLAENFTPQDIQLYYQIALKGKQDLPFAPCIKSGFEMIMLRMLYFTPFEHTNTGSSNHDDSLCHSRVSSYGASVKQESGNPISIHSEHENPPWHEILPQLDISGPTKALAAHCSIETKTNDKFILLLHAKHAPMLHKKHEERLSKALSEFYQTQIQVKIKIVTEQLETPNMLATKKFNEKQQKAHNLINGNSNIQALQENFNATILTDTIQPEEDIV